jgi:hypothetical protein
MGTYFRPEPKIKRAPTKNSGVRMDAMDNNGKKETYYGYIEEI